MTQSLYNAVRTLRLHTVFPMDGCKINAVFNTEQSSLFAIQGGHSTEPFFFSLPGLWQNGSNQKMMSLSNKTKKRFFLLPLTL